MTDRVGRDRESRIFNADTAVISKDTGHLPKVAARFALSLRPGPLRTVLRGVPVLVEQARPHPGW